jgi:hypothetical protein
MPSFSRHPLPVDAGHLRTAAVANADLLEGFGEGRVPRSGSKVDLSLAEKTATGSCGSIANRRRLEVRPFGCSSPESLAVIRQRLLPPNFALLEELCERPLAKFKRRSRSPRKFPVTGRSRRHAEVAVAVETRRWRQRGEAVEQLERGQVLRATATGARFRRLVNEVLEVVLAQAVQRERWPGAVPQQPLAPGTVGGRDAHLGVDGEAAAMLSLPHRLRVIGWQQAAAHEHAQQAPAHLRLHLRDGVGLEPGGGPEDDLAHGGGVERAVDDDRVEVQMSIEAGTKAVIEGHRAQTRRGA